jgi:hypothetical protein
MGILNLRGRIMLHSARKCRKEAEFKKKTFFIKHPNLNERVFDEFGATSVVPIYLYDRIGNHRDARLKPLRRVFFINHLGRDYIAITFASETLEINSG